MISALLLVPIDGSAQTTTQAWAHIDLDWIASSRTTYQIELEPKVLIAAPGDQPGWRTLDLTPSVHFALTNYLDLITELRTGWTKQTDDLDSTEITGRLGVRFHLFSRRDHLLGKEKLPKRRLVMQDFLRIEWRNLFYSDDHSESVWRVRNRLEFFYPLNRPSLADDGTVSVQSDWEWFIPISDPQERFANRQQIRAGFGYRPNRAWRFLALYVWIRSRDTTAEPFTTDAHCFDIQIRRTW